MPIFVACSTLGGLNNNIMSISRLTIAASRNGHLPKVWGLIHGDRMTPITSLVLNSFLTLVVLAYKDLREVLTIRHLRTTKRSLPSYLTG